MPMLIDRGSCVLACVSSVVAIVLCLASASAQSDKDVNRRTNSVAETAAATQPEVEMRDPAPGDHWTYEVKDEILGTIKRTRMDIITDISKNEIAVRVDFSDKNFPGSIVYDNSWNLKRDPPFKYSPNDGTGVQFPLKLGTEWKFAIDTVNSNNGLTFKRTGKSRVVAQESVTTKAGTFDTFVIETDFTGKNTQDPTNITQVSMRTWFNADVNHWIRRNFVARRSGHVTQNNVLELIEYGRKKH
jgi:hypothetical protein